MIVINQKDVILSQKQNKKTMKPVKRFQKDKN